MSDEHQVVPRRGEPTGAKLFLSYARADDEPFVKRLYQRLVAEGFDVWWDRENMPSRALTFLKEIREAVRAVDRVVVVVGPQCVTSDYCRAEWQAALAEAKVVNPLLRVGEYTLLPPELANTHCPDVRADVSFEDAMRETLRVLADPIPPLGALRGGVPDLPPHFQPRPAAISRLAEVLLIDETQPVVLTGPERVTVLHGMGGTGKSVLASTFSRSTSTRRAFSDGVHWLDAGLQATPLDLAVGLGRLLSTPPQGHTDLPTCTTDLASALETLSALVVVDNAWRVEQFEPLIDALGPACRLLVTTRIGELATASGAGAVELLELSPEAALQHLADWAGGAPGELPEEAAAIASECGQLPFALALNGAMHEQGVSWSDLLEALRAAEIDFAETRFKGYPHPTVLSTIQVSVDALDAENADSGRLLRELAAFHEGAGLPEAAVGVLWRHTGALAPRHVSKLLTRLAGRALLRLEGAPGARRVVLHDLQRDYLVRVTDAGQLNKSLLAAYEKASDADWLRIPNDGYAHRHLIRHLLEAGRGESVHALLDRTTDRGANAWFEVNAAIDGVGDYLADLDRVREGSVDRGRATHLSLMRTSVENRLARIPAELQRALLAEGRMKGESALASLRFIHDREQRVLAWLELLPQLDEVARSAALAACIETVRGRGAQVRARFLPRIASHLEGQERAALVAEGLEAARTCTGEFRAAGLAAALELVDEPLRGPLAAEAAAALEQSVGSTTLRQDLAAVALYVPGLANRLLEQARLLGEPFMTAMAFTAIVPHLPEVERATAAREGIALFESSGANGLWIVIALAGHVPEFDLDALIRRAVVEDSRQVPYLVKTLPTILSGALLESALRAITEAAAEFPEPNRTRTRITMLSGYDSARRRSEVEALLSDIEQLPYDSWRRDAYESLIPEVERDQLPELAARLGRLEDGPSLIAGAAALAVYGDVALRREVLSAVLQLDASLEKFSALVALARTPEDDQHAAVLDAAYALRDEVPGWQRVSELIVELAPRYPASERSVLLSAGWSAALGVPGFIAEQEFVKLAPLLAEPALVQGFRHLLEESERLSQHRQQYWTADGPQVSDNSSAVADTLNGIARALPEVLLSDAVELARRVSSAPWRWVALCHLVPRLVEPQRSRILEEVTVLVRAGFHEADSDDRFMTAACRGLGHLIPALDPDDRKSLRDVLWSLISRVDAGWLPGLMEDVSPALGAEQCEVLARRSLARPNLFAPLAMSQVVGEAERGPLLLQSLHALSLGDSTDPVHMDCLTSTVTALLAAPEDVRSDAWRQASDRLRGKRAAVALHLAALAPLVESVGERAVLIAAAQSLLTVRSWWP